ncbi:MAG: hypothetical protein WC615_00385 [Mucilaginibacter sp.]|jgi:hypothetical protein|uniref:hypothetical protein n=1 Tax=Mucilaginibacter sp. TaxID=1882438 RepID=UPI00356A8AE1
MKNNKSKKLTREISTICDFKSPTIRTVFGDTETGTDPTNITIITLTTVNTHQAGQKLTA